MIKAIFFDVDGTLVSLRTHAVPQSTQNALARLREKGAALCGKCFAVCPYTQRWLRSSQDQPRL